MDNPKLRVLIYFDCGYHGIEVSYNPEVSFESYADKLLAMSKEVNNHINKNTFYVQQIETTEHDKFGNFLRDTNGSPERKILIPKNWR